MVNHLRRQRRIKRPRIGMWLQNWDYDTKAECDTIISFAKYHGITDLFAIAVNSSPSPKVAMGISVLCNMTATTFDGVRPFTYLCREAKAVGIRVHAWWCIYLPSWWIGATAVLATPITDDDTADTGTHDVSNGGSCINFHNQSGVRTPIINAIKEFASLNPDAAGINLDYIRTDGTVTFQQDADLTAFVSELRTAVPDKEISVCAVGGYYAKSSNHQDIWTWINSDYIDTLTTMAYYTCAPTKFYTWDGCDFTGKTLMVGIGSEEGGTTEINCTRPSDNRASFRQYSELYGYENFCLFSWDDAFDTAARQDTLDDYLKGRLQVVAPYPAISSINITPGTSIALIIGGTTYTTLYADVTDHTYSGGLKQHIEGVEGQRPWIHYQRNTTSTIRIQVGDWEL